VDQIVPAEQRVSYHAVTRYVQRMLGVTVDLPDTVPSFDRAIAHCDAAGVTMEAVRAKLLSPAVTRAIAFGLRRFAVAGVFYHISANGVIVTVIKAATVSYGRCRVLGGKNARHEADRRRCRRPKFSTSRNQEADDDA
jgi:hypothetical protein